MEKAPCFGRPGRFERTRGLPPCRVTPTISPYLGYGNPKNWGFFMLELLIAVILLGFFATLIALVAIVHKESDVAKHATEVLGKLLPKTQQNKFED